MADLDAVKETKEYFLDIPQKSEAFYLKGSNALGWGMQNRLAQIFNPKTGRTVMLAICAHHWMFFVLFFVSLCFYCYRKDRYTFLYYEILIIF